MKRIIIMSLQFALLLNSISFGKSYVDKKINEFSNELIQAIKKRDAEKIISYASKDVFLIEGTHYKPTYNEFKDYIMEDYHYCCSEIDAKLLKIDKLSDIDYRIKILVHFYKKEKNDEGININYEKPFYFFVVTNKNEIKLTCISDEFGLKWINSLDVIKKYIEYDNKNLKDFDGFYYSHESDSNLIALKNKFQFEQLIAQKDEINKIIELMEWVNHNFKWDGGSNNIYPQNALSIIKQVKETNRGVNCGQLATVLTEIYLSVGFKSRFIVCESEDENPKERHIITIVYSNKLDKWIFMDPAFNAYFKDENGLILSIEEIRERFISGKYLDVNNELNINGKHLNKTWYKKYIAKNFVRFTCLVDNTFGGEDKKNKLYIRLNPVKHIFANKPNVEISEGIKYFNTSNPEIFWKKPDY